MARKNQKNAAITRPDQRGATNHSGVQLQSKNKHLNSACHCLNYATVQAKKQNKKKSTDATAGVV